MSDHRLFRLFSSCGLRRGLSTAVSSPPRAFKFHIGASFAGKPENSRGQLPEEQTRLFESTSPIGIWKENTMRRKKSVKSTSAGDDFFFVQEVSLEAYDIIVPI